MSEKQKLLELCSQGITLSEPQKLQLAATIWQEPLRAAAFGIEKSNIEQSLQERSQLLQKVYPKLQALQAQSLKISECLIEPLWDVWLPLANWLVQKHLFLQRPLIQGIIGGQGAGKSTLGKILHLILHELGYKCLSISLDDFYKTYADRMQLRLQDPRLIWRGPPGTHDVQLAIEVLTQLKQAQHFPIDVPQFDKFAFQGAGDRSLPLLIDQPVDIVLFEGWFVGVHPLPADVAQVTFANAPSPIDTDSDRSFALDMNANLATYIPLWKQLDSLILLDLADYRLSKQWRQQAEAQAYRMGRTGMSAVEVEQFVDYFWRALHPDIFIQPLRYNSQLVDLVIEVVANHLPERVYQPQSLRSSEL